MTASSRAEDKTGTIYGQGESGMTAVMGHPIVLHVEFYFAGVRMGIAPNRDQGSLRFLLRPLHAALPLP